MRQARDMCGVWGIWKVQVEAGGVVAMALPIDRDAAIKLSGVLGTLMDIRAELEPKAQRDPRVPDALAKAEKHITEAMWRLNPVAGDWEELRRLARAARIKVVVVAEEEKA